MNKATTQRRLDNREGAKNDDQEQQHGRERYTASKKHQGGSVRGDCRRRCKQ